MKTLLFSIMVLFTALQVSCSNDETINDTLQATKDETVILTNLTPEEKNDLLFLREEEKLARDVYLYAYEKYNLPIFNNIASSETQHMARVLDLLNTYNIDDPAFSEMGVFNNKDLQKIYNDLIKQVNISLLEALKVGNIIEDLDINDIALNEKRTTKTDIQYVYSALKCGSRNHLRSFNKQVIQNNGSYSPFYISEDDFNTIINTTNEKCGLM